MNNRNRMCLCYVIVILAAMCLLKKMRKEKMSCNKEHYRLAPTGVMIAENEASKGSIFDLPYGMECVPGPSPQTSPYTKDLTPGGVCGAQKYVDAAASYTITGGIGGSLI